MELFNGRCDGMADKLCGLTPEEIKIIKKLSAVQDYKKQLFEQRAKLEELFDSVLAKSMAAR